jgi:hypothetical protein
MLGKASRTVRDLEEGSPALRRRQQVGAGIGEEKSRSLSLGEQLATSRRDTSPSNAAMLDLLLDWADNEATRHGILIENPAQVYGF